MRTLSFLTIVLIGIASCGPDSSPEKRMNKKNHELEQKVASIWKQQQILRDSISIINKKIDTLNKK